jgi:hypothetical protein
MKFKKTLRNILLAGTITIGAILLVRYPNKSKSEHRNIVGEVFQVDKEELIYVDTKGFGSSNNIYIPVTFLGVGAEGKKYQIILTGSHNLKQGDSIDLDYLVDNEVTGTEILKRFYPKEWSYAGISKPDVRFKVDGYVTAWKKINLSGSARGNR